MGSDGLSIGKDAADRGGAGFLGAAKGFVFQGGDASFFVAGGTGSRKWSGCGL